MRKTILKWLTLTLLLCYAGWIAVWAGDQERQQVCGDVQIKVCGTAVTDTMTKAGVTEHLSHYGRRLQGAPVTQIDTEHLEHYLGRLSNLEAVQCVLTSDHTLRIEVTPMQPELRVFDRSGSHYVNRAGKTVPTNARFFADVPVVRGEFSDSFRPTDVMPLTRFIQSDPFMRELVAMVEARDADNLLLVPRIHGHIINFGDTTRLAEKRDALLSMYRKVLPYKGWETYDTISVRFRGQVVATRRDKARPAHGEQYDEEVDPEEATLPEVEPRDSSPA